MFLDRNEAMPFSLTVYGGAMTALALMTVLSGITI